MTCLLNSYQLQDLCIPRYVLSYDAVHKQILGYCDASKKGFAVVIYLRVMSSNRDAMVSLQKAKMKLAPLKTISQPRLELSGGHLLKLLLSVKSFLDSLNLSHIFLFTNSTIILSWLKYLLIYSRPSLGTTYPSKLLIQKCHQIPSKENPANLAFRGLLPFLLQHYSLWWTGPSSLQHPDWIPSSSPDYTQKVSKLKYGVTLVIIIQESYLISWISKHSKYKNMLRVMAYVKRFIYNYTETSSRLSGQLISEELDSALSTAIRITQSYESPENFLEGTTIPYPLGYIY